MDILLIQSRNRCLIPIPVVILKGPANAGGAPSLAQGGGPKLPQGRGVVDGAPVGGIPKSPGVRGREARGRSPPLGFVAPIAAISCRGEGSDGGPCRGERAPHRSPSSEGRRGWSDGRPYRRKKVSSLPGVASWGHRGPEDFVGRGRGQCWRYRCRERWHWRGREGSERGPRKGEKSFSRCPGDGSTRRVGGEMTPSVARWMREESIGVGVQVLS